MTRGALLALLLLADDVLTLGGEDLTLPDSACIPCGISPAGRLQLYAGAPCPRCGVPLVTMAEACAHDDAPKRDGPRPEAGAVFAAGGPGGGRGQRARGRYTDQGDL